MTQEFNAIVLKDRFKKALNAMLIPQTWALSHQIHYPVIIKEDIGCDKGPDIDWTGTFVHWMSKEAYKRRVCNKDTDGKSYWLVGARNPHKTCKGGTAEDQTSCDAWGSLPGMDELDNNKYQVTFNDVVFG